MEEWFIKCLGSKWQRGGEKVKLIQVTSQNIKVLIKLFVWYTCIYFGSRFTFKPSLLDYPKLKEQSLNWIS